MSELSRKLNLIDASINAYDHEPRAQTLGSTVLLFKNHNPFGSVLIREGDLWLSFYSESNVRRVTDDSVEAIVDAIEGHRP